MDLSGLLKEQYALLPISVKPSRKYDLYLEWYVSTFHLEPLLTHTRSVVMVLLKSVLRTYFQSGIFSFTFAGAYAKEKEKA